MRTMTALIAVVGGLVLGSLAVSSMAAPSTTLDIEQLMTAEDLRATGVGGLTPDQKVALGSWLAKYSASLLESAKSGKSGGAYAGVGGGHWVSKKVGSGEYIVLEDGSLWEIQALDRVDTILWLTTTSITVVEADNPVGDFRYTLINTDDGEKALARYRGRK